MNNYISKFLLSISIAIVIYFFIKNEGLIDYNQEYNYYYNLLSKKDSLSNELFELQIENKWLEDNKEYIEKIAREKYFYIYPDEKIINF